MKILGALSWFFFASLSLAAPTTKIAKVELEVDQRIGLNIRRAMYEYLGRYIGQAADMENTTACERFLTNLYFVDKADCSLQQNGFLLFCRVEPKHVVSEVQFRNLPASLLESELKRKLPVQSGQSIDFSDQGIKSTGALIKSRVEAFLRKNGYYGAELNVDFTEQSDSLSLLVVITIEGGAFVRVNKISVLGNITAKQKRGVSRLYDRMCLSPSRIFDAFSSWTLRCYSRELEQEATSHVQEMLAKTGHITATIRVGHAWINPHDKSAPKHCQKRDINDSNPRCVDLEIDIKPGPKVTWSVNMLKGRMVSRNVASRLISSIFMVDQISRASSGLDDEESADRMIIKEDLLKSVKFVEAKNMDEREINSAAKRMKEHLSNLGYINAEVTPTITQIDTNNIHIDFNVYSGKAYSIRNISIAPEKFQSLINESELEAWITTRGFSSAGNLSYEQIPLTLDEIIRRAHERGYRDVSGKSELTALDSNINVAFFLDSKPRQVIKQLKIKNGIESINSPLVSSLRNCDHFYQGSCQGSSLIRSSIASDEAKITAVYQANDYLYVKVKSQLKEEKDGIKLIFTVYDERYGEDTLEPLVKQRINGMFISGNRNTRLDVIERLFPRPNDEQTSLSLKKGIANLRESGRFSRIDHKLMDAQEKSNDVYFALQLTERPSINIDTGISISTDKLLSLEAELEDSNLFSSMLNLKTKLALGLFWGRQSSISNKLVWPFIWGKPFSLSLHAPMIVYDDKTHRKKEPFTRVQSRVVAGLDWRANANLTPYIRYSLVHNKEKTYKPGQLPQYSFKERLRNLDGLIPTVQDPEPGIIAGVLKPGISYINLDNLFDPRLGVDTNNWVELSAGPFQGDIPFMNFGTQNRLFLPMGPFTWAFQSTFMLAFIKPSYDNFKHIRNYSSLDKLGGDRSLRGYDDGFIGVEAFHQKPELFAGYFSNIANVELRFPLSSSLGFGSLSGAIFADQGTLFPSANLFHLGSHETLKDLIDQHGFGFSFGASIRYLLPVGPVSLDYGIAPLHHQQRLHLQFGYAF